MRAGSGATARVSYDSGWEAVLAALVASASG